MPALKAKKLGKPPQEKVLLELCSRLAGFDHGAGHPLLFLDDAKAPNCRKHNGFKGLGNYSEWPKVAGAVIKAEAPIHK